MGVLVLYRHRFVGVFFFLLFFFPQSGGVDLDRLVFSF